MTQKFLHYATAEEARSATHCYFDSIMMAFEPDILLHRGTAEEAIQVLRESLPTDIKRYLHARARAVELQADRLDKFPEDIVGFLRRRISDYLHKHTETSGQSHIRKVITGADSLLAGMEL